MKNNIAERFDAIYDILSIKKNWNQGSLVDYDPAFERKWSEYYDDARFIDQVKPANGGIPDYAPPGLNFCLYGAVQFVNGPDEEQIAAALVIACTIKLNPNKTFKQLVKIMFDESRADTQPIFETVHYSEFSSDRLLSELHAEVVSNIESDPDDSTLLEMIFKFNDRGNKNKKHAQVLEAVKLAKKLYGLIDAIDSGKSYSNERIAELLGIKA